MDILHPLCKNPHKVGRILAHGIIGDDDSNKDAGEPSLLKPNLAFMKRQGGSNPLSLGNAPKAHTR